MASEAVGTGSIPVGTTSRKIAVKTLESRVFEAERPSKTEKAGCSDMRQNGPKCAEMRF